MTKAVKVAPEEINGAASAISGHAQNVTDLLLASFQLHQGKLSDEAWLELFARAVNCDAASCVRWSNSRPDYPIISAYGQMPELPADWRAQTDKVINNSACRHPGFIEDFVEATLEPKLYTAAIIADSRVLAGVVDWEPACIIMLMVRNSDKPEWTVFERQRVAKVLGYVRESISVHKELDRRRFTGGLASDILNNSPRGIIALSEDGVIELTNARAEEMLDCNDGLSRQHGKLLIGDKKAASALAAHLAGISEMTGDGLPEMDWNLVVKRPSGAPGYQIILGSLRLRDWNIESRHSDRVAIIYLHDRIDRTRPTTTQLRDFYGLTTAQARMAGAIYSGKTITDAAEALHISVNTARSHMRGIYAKVGVKTQSELISLLASGLKTFGKRID